jgi:hypothetical protein
MLFMTRASRQKQEILYTQQKNNDGKTQEQTSAARGKRENGGGRE